MGEDIQNLFRHCMQLRQAFRQLELVAGRVQEIAMNGSVSAAQTGRQARVYGEVAHQVAIAARRMRQLVEGCRAEVDGIVSLTLKALVVERSYGKYAEARPHVRRDANVERLGVVMAELRCRLEDLMRGVPGHAAPVEAALKNLGQTQDRLFSVVSKLRVELVDLQGSQAAAISGLADRLAAGIEETTAVIQDLASLVRMIADAAKCLATAACREDDHAEIRIVR